MCQIKLQFLTEITCLFLYSFLVDNTPIRVFKNGESIGVPFPKNQPMKIYSSLWNADDWATRGGLVKADWTKAPFTAYYRGFNVQTCTGSCTSSVSGWTWQSQELDAYSRRRLRWVQKNFMISNYCGTDIDIDIDQWCRRTNHHIQPHLRISLSLSHISTFKPTFFFLINPRPSLSTLSHGLVPSLSSV